MPTTHSFIRAALGYAFIYIAVIIVLAFTIIQAGEFITFIVNPHHGVLAKLAYMVVMAALTSFFVFSVYMIFGPDIQRDEFVMQ
jgi:hypothetical protein